MRPLLSRGATLALLWTLAACATPSASPPATPAATAPSAVGGAATPPAAAAVAPTATAPASTARQKVDLPLAALSASAAPVWVAVDQGFFAEQGLDVEVNAMAPATASQAITSGSAPLGITGGSTVTAWIGGASELVFVAGLLNKAVFEVLGGPEIASVEDLRGKTVASTTPGSGASIALYETLRRLKLEPERDLQVIYVRDLPSVTTALLNGTVQGAVLSSPFAERALAGNARLLVEVADLDIDLATLNVTSTRGLLDRDPAFLRRFLMGYVQGMQYAREHPAEAATAIMRGTRSEDRAEAESGYRANAPSWSIWVPPTAVQTVLDNTTDVPAARTARAADLIDERILRELERSGWLAEHYRNP